MANLKLLDPNQDVVVEPEQPTEEPGLGGSLKWAVYTAFGFFSALLVFAIFAPISGGALATGQISPEGSRRVVQHLEGGIISRILVDDGDRVKQGDALLTLNETQTLAERNVLRARVNTLKVMEARMEAEQLSERDIILPLGLPESDAQLESFIRRQRTLLTQSLDLAAARGGLLSERTGQLRSEIEGLESSIVSLRQQQIIIRREIAGLNELVGKGIYNDKSPRLLGLEREEANIDGQVAQSQAAIARLRGQMSEINVQRLELEAQRQSDIAAQLAEVRAQLAESEERLIAAEDVLERTTLRAPVDGTVVNLRYRTVGGVVPGTQPVVDVVPENEKLIIVAQVSPTDIDIIRPGQIAKVTFSALPRSLPQIDGNVLTVSADTKVDEATGMAFYEARVQVPQETLDELNITGNLYPGMPAELMIKTESRTLMQYLIQPFQDTFRSALRESDNANQ